MGQRFSILLFDFHGVPGAELPLVNSSEFSLGHVFEKQRVANARGTAVDPEYPHAALVLDEEVVIS